MGSRALVVMRSCFGSTRRNQSTFYSGEASPSRSQATRVLAWRSWGLAQGRADTPWPQARERTLMECLKLIEHVMRGLVAYGLHTGAQGGMAKRGAH